MQERSVSNMNPMDDQLRVPLLESHDEGDPPQQGLLIQAPVGRGPLRLRRRVLLPASSRQACPGPIGSSLTC